MKYIIKIIGVFICFIYAHYTFSGNLEDAVNDLLYNTDNNNRFYVFMCSTIAPDVLAESSFTLQAQFRNDTLKHCNLHASFIPYDDMNNNYYKADFIEEFFPNPHTEDDSNCKRDGDRPAMPIPIPGVGDQKPIDCSEFIPRTGVSFLLSGENLQGDYIVPSTGDHIILIQQKEKKMSKEDKQLQYRQLSQYRVNHNNSYSMITQDSYTTVPATIYPLIEKDSLHHDGDRPAMPIPIPGVGELMFFSSTGT